MRVHVSPEGQSWSECRATAVLQIRAHLLVTVSLTPAHLINHNAHGQIPFTPFTVITQSTGHTQYTQTHTDTYSYRHTYRHTATHKAWKCNWFKGVKEWKIICVWECVWLTLRNKVITAKKCYQHICSKPSSSKQHRTLYKVCFYDKCSHTYALLFTICINNKYCIPL